MFALTTPCFNAARSSAGAAAAHLGATPEPCSALSSRDCGGSRLLVVARWRARRVRVAASTRAGPETETEGSPLDFPEVRPHALCGCRRRRDCVQGCTESEPRTLTSRAGGRSARGKLELCSDSHANTHMTLLSLLLPFWQEWMKATPSRRPDIFPEFKPLKPQLPQPMPGDPEVPNDEEEADEKRQKVRVAA